MPFKMQCPHCRKSLNVTEKAFGKTLPCPGCGKPLTVPMGPPQAASGAPSTPVRQPAETALPQSHIQPLVVPPPVAPSATVPPMPPSIPPMPPMPPLLVNTVQVAVADRRPSNSLGIGSIVLAIVGLLTVCIPMVALPLLLLGFALGIAGLVVAIKRKGGGIGLPIAGTAICGVLLIPPAFMLLTAGAFVGAVNQAVKENERSTARRVASIATDSPISTTDLEATIQRTHKLIQQVHDESARARIENRGNEMALRSAVTHTCDQGKKRLDQEFSSLQGKNVRWRFIVREVRQGFGRGMVVALNEGEHRDFMDDSFGYIGQTDIGFRFGEAGDTTLEVGKGVPESLAEKLRPGDPLLVEGTVRVNVGAEANTFVIPHPTSISVVFQLTGITVEAVR